ncbi:methyltransferase domain-containing protein [Roseibium sp. AS2]|uniref:class I SAM-dependent methyltransferase n=1 Tax=Roseibium sp. AS2 TaxID=3135781 RepID=UPI00316C3BA3
MPTVQKDNRAADGGGFFDLYPQFLETSQTGADRDRLNERHRAIIDDNRDIIQGSRLLDIASHDGRWSFAALTAGARHCTGIEIRPYLVRNSVVNMQTQQIADERYTFLCGDALSTISTLEAGQYDVIMCLGYLYHTAHIPLLIQEICRLKPAHVIVDTQVGVPVGFHEPPDWLELSKGIYGRFFMEQLTRFLSEQPLILLHEDETQREGMSVDTSTSDPWVPVGYPTKGALEFLLGKAGYGAFRYYDWFGADLANPVPLFDYRNGYRVTMRCSAKT